jgi:hypothetical protein
LKDKTVFHIVYTQDRQKGCTAALEAMTTREKKGIGGFEEEQGTSDSIHFISFKKYLR